MIEAISEVTWSRVTVPQLVFLLISAVYGLNEMRMTLRTNVLDRHAAKELALAMSFMALASSTGLMLWGIAHGIEVITWRGSVLISGFAGVILFVGKFQPWRRWLRRTVPLERQWRSLRRPTPADLSELVGECRRAVQYGADECQRALLKAIAALEVLAAEREEMERIRNDLVDVVSHLQHRFRTSQTIDKVVVQQMDAVLTRLQEALAYE